MMLASLFHYFFFLCKEKFHVDKKLKFMKQWLHPFWPVPQILLDELDVAHLQTSLTLDGILELFHTSYCMDIEQCCTTLLSV